LKALDSSQLNDRVKNARKVYLKAYDSLKANGLKEERVVLLDSLLSFEENYGDQGQVEDVKNRMPKSVKKRRRLMDEYGEPSGWEEYYDYIFPDDEDEKPSLKLLEMAHLWKQKMAAASKTSEN
jgi:crooked neck